MLGQKTSLPDSVGFVISPLSYYLRANDLNVTVVGPVIPQGVVDALPIEFRLASLTGYLIALKKPTSNDDVAGFNKVRETLIRAGYVYKDFQVDQSHGYLIPSPFFGAAPELLSFLDGRTADEIAAYMYDWEDNETELAGTIKANNTARTQLSDANATLARLQTDIESYRAQKAALQTDVEAIKAEASLLKQQLHDLGPLNLLSNDETVAPLDFIASVMNYKPRRVINYDPKKDFLKPVLHDSLVSIEGKSYDSPQVSNKYLQPEMVEALDSLVENEEAELRRIGLWPFKLASAARTPLQQLDTKNQNPVAAGMFSSGHVFGAAVDIAVVGTTYDKDRHWPDLQRVLAKHGLDLPANLKVKDPNHVFLRKFQTDKVYANKNMLKMLQRYNTELVFERNYQLTLTERLDKEGKDLNEKTKVLNSFIADAQKKTEDLKKEIEDLEKQKTAAQRDLELTKAAIAVQNAGKEQDRERLRAWYGEGSKTWPDKDEYWERYIRQEFHGSDSDRRCWGRRETYENSRGDWRQSTGMACEAKGSRGGMQRPN